jgi:capsular polysaccharide biosynthesis protein
LDGPSNEWQEWPGFIESVWRYRTLVVAAALLGVVVAGAWSLLQPTRYEGVVRVFLDIEDDRTVDPGRIVNSQAQYLTSPVVLQRAVALIGNRLSRVELSKRLTVKPAQDANVITVRALDATPERAASLANTVVRAYREVVAEQAVEASSRDIANLQRRQKQLEHEIVVLDEQHRAQPGNVMLQANRDAKDKELRLLADQEEGIRRDAVSSTRRAETVRETAPIPDEPVQPKPLQNVGVGALLGLVVAAGLAWWINGRRLADLRLLESLHAKQVGREARPALTAKEALALARGALARGALARGFRRDSRQITMNGSPAGDGSASGIADFDQVATSIQQLLRSLDGPPRKLYEENLPNMVVEQIAQSFPVDLAVILLKTDDGVRTMGSVGPETVSDDALDHAAPELIEDAASSGPRLVYLDELRSLAGTGLETEEDVSLALVPLVRDQVGFGVLLTGRRQNGDGDAVQLGDEEVEQIAAATYDMVPHLWAWLLLRSLKLRLRTLQ